MYFQNGLELRTSRLVCRILLNIVKLALAQPEGVMGKKIFRGPYSIGAHRVKGPKEVAPNKRPMQTRGPYR